MWDYYVSSYLSNIILIEISSSYSYNKKQQYKLCIHVAFHNGSLTDFILHLTCVIKFTTIKEEQKKQSI